MEPTADFSAIIARVRELGPFTGDDDATRAVASTLQALARLLTRDERDELAAALPAELRHVVPATRDQPSAKESDLYLWVAVIQGIPLNRAVEHVQIACRALAEQLPEAIRSRLQRNLREIGALFAPAALAEPNSDRPPPPIAHDLAEGHEGGRHPLATANPALMAHRHSVARNADPHSDSRLSSARGLTQEREDETFATGEPGSRRPLSRSH